MTTDICILVKGDLIAQSTQPEKDILSVLLRFTTLSAWKIWEQDAQSQLFVLRFITDKLKNDYPRVTVQMFEAAIMEGVVSKRGYERSATTLFQMLEDWLIDHSAEIYDARRAPGEDGPKLAERTESQKHQDKINLFVTLYNCHKNGERIVGGWSTPYQILKDKGIHVPGAAINSELWALVRSNKKRGFVDALKSSVESERNEARQAIDNWETWMENNATCFLGDYEQAICRHYFDLLGDDILDLIK
jgi:hypothetical protein